MKKTVKEYIIGILIPIAVGGLSALLSTGNMDIYDEITKPPLAPPGILFPIVWTFLYILMGTSSILIYRNRKNSTTAQRNQALFFYGIQLLVNFFWSLLFFNVRLFMFSFLWLILLLVMIMIMIVKFIKINPIAGYLQVPYLLWVTFAGYLNLMIYILNM